MHTGRPFYNTSFVFSGITGPSVTGFSSASVGYSRCDDGRWLSKVLSCYEFKTRQFAHDGATIAGATTPICWWSLGLLEHRLWRSPAASCFRSRSIVFRLLSMIQNLEPPTQVETKTGMLPSLADYNWHVPVHHRPGFNSMLWIKV